MATLASLFNESSTKIYNKFTPDGGQLVSISPDSNRGVLNRTKGSIKYDTRALPISSVVRDVARVSKLLNPFRSPSAVLYLAKQALLQTGNTFKQTRIYDPLSPLLNVAPFLHTLRAYKQDPYLYLQAETIRGITQKFGNPITLTNKDVITRIASNVILSRPEGYVFYTAKDGSAKSVLGPRLYAQQTILTRGQVKSQFEPLKPIDTQQYPTEFSTAAIAFRDNFNKGTALKQSLIKSNRNDRLRSSYLNDKKYSDTNTDPTTTSLQSGLSNISDEYNKTKTFARDSQKIQNDRIDYGNIITSEETLNKNEKTDIIKFIFSDAGGTNVNPVQFRALLSSLKENVKPEFNDQRYVGRTERFVTYGGAKRSVSISFNVVAFSSQELEGVWSRINYLSGLAFPKGVANGFMIPPMFNITVGNIYDNQPCYIEGLDYDFLEDNTVFDIENEVPFAVNVSMQLNLFEKRSKFQNSPFYKITEDILTNQLRVERSANFLRNVSTQRSATTVAPIGATAAQLVFRNNSGLATDGRAPAPRGTVPVGFSTPLSNADIQGICQEDAECTSLYLNNPY